MNLQSLSSIDLPALSRPQLASLVRVLRDEYNAGWVDTRTNNRNLIVYIEQHKARLAKQEASTEIPAPVAPTEAKEPVLKAEATAPTAVAPIEEIKIADPDVVVVYHKKSEMFHCLDGVLSAIIAKRALALKRTVFLAGTHYNNDFIIKKINELAPSRVFFLDYSMPHEDIKRLKVGNATVCDHHKDACERLISAVRAERSLSRVSSPQLAVRFNNNKSGARLAWEYFFPSVEVPHLVEYVEDGDLFSFYLPHAELICAGIYSLISPGMSLEEVESSLSPVWDMTRKEFANYFKERGKLAKTEKKKRIIAAAEKAKVMPVHGRKAVAVEVSASDQDIISQLGKYLYSQPSFIENGLRFVAIHYTEGDTCYVSLRSGGFNCLPVARAYGGGGHEQACGFRLAGKWSSNFPDRPVAY